MKRIVPILRWIRKNAIYLLGYSASFYVATYLVTDFIRECQEEKERDRYREVARKEKAERRLREEKDKRQLEDERRQQDERRKLEEEKEFQSGKIDGHAFVDLGLPSGTLWAKMNIGASSPEEAGEYFAWGETSGYHDSSERNFSKEEYVYYDKTYDRFTKYCSTAESGKIDNKTELESIDDAATANWGANWQMPSNEQIIELQKYCTLRKWENNRIEGWVLIGPNDSLLFIPANTVIVDGKTFVLDHDYPFAAFWSRNQSSLLGPDNELSVISRFYDYVFFNHVESGKGTSQQSRWSGMCVRPVVKEREKRTFP